MHIVDHSKNIIEVDHVSFAYDDREVLTDVTFNVHQGDYLALVGPNGAGKTTLLKIILGLLSPSKGTVRLYGKDIRSFKDWPRISYVPQKATSFDQNFPLTVEEVVLMGRYARRGLLHRVTGEDREFARKALEQVEMWQYRDRLIGDLSGGQQQRVFIARALAGQPEVIFLDEPTTGVDERTHDEFYALLRKLNDELNLTLVLVSHDFETVKKEAMHIAYIDHTLVSHTTVEAFTK